MTGVLNSGNSLAGFESGVSESLVSRSDRILQWYDSWLMDCEDAGYVEVGAALQMLDTLRDLAVELRLSLPVEEL